MTRRLPPTFGVRLALVAAALMCACSRASTGALPGDAGTGDSTGTGAEDSTAADVAPPDTTPSPPDSMTGGACAPNATFTPYPWKPPTPFHQAACNAQQVASYLSCFSFGDCAPFKGVPQNAACVACIETEVSAPAHGPVITVGGAIQEVNFGGCQATYDGDLSSTSCGATFNDLNSCIVNECGDCLDAIENGPQFQACTKAAFLPGGPCTRYDETPTCRAETSAGGVAAGCLAIASFLPTWCGPVQGDASVEAASDASGDAGGGD
jgi:hypothetical protein